MAAEQIKNIITTTTTTTTTTVQNFQALIWTSVALASCIALVLLVSFIICAAGRCSEESCRQGTDYCTNVSCLLCLAYANSGSGMSSTTVTSTTTTTSISH